MQQTQDRARPPMTLPSLTGLRFLAALLVFGYHLVVVQYFDQAAQPVLQVLYGGGGAGVTLFFVLSGFVLTWGHDPAVTARRFWLRRVARVSPLHLVGIALALVVGLLWVPVIRTGDPAALVANVLLVSAWNPAWWQAGNPVSWSLVCEAFFYAVLPLLLPLLRRRGPAALGLLAVASVAAISCSSLLAEASPLPVSAYSTPLLRLPDFLLGVLTALLLRSGAVRPPRVVVAVPVALLGLLLTTPFSPVPAGSVPIGGATAAAFALLIAALARHDVEGRRSPLGSPALVALGRRSFAFYLVHLLVVASVSSPWPDGHPNLPLLPALALAAVSLSITLLLASLLHRGIEVPAHRAILRAAGPPTRGAPAPSIRTETAMDTTRTDGARQTGERRPRTGRRSRGALLVLVTALVLALAAATGAWQPQLLGADLLTLGLSAAVLVVGRRRPVAVLAIVAVLVALPSSALMIGEVRTIPIALAGFAAAAAGLPRRVTAPVACLAALAGQSPDWPGQLSQPDLWGPILRGTDVSSTLLVVVGTLAAVLLGTAAFRQERDADALRRRNEELEALRASDRLRVVNQERAAIAREIHDTVAHHVAAIVVRAQAADRVGGTDPRAAADAVRWIAGSGQEALGDMRAIVRVLRSDEDAGVPPRLTTDLGTALDAVVRRVRAAGLVVDADVDPVPALPGVQEAAVLRVAQEALTNALMHAPASPVDLRLGVVDGAAVLRVRSTSTSIAPGRRTGRGGGNGLRIMHERAAAAGGLITAGADGAGWTVELVLPVALSALAGRG